MLVKGLRLVPELCFERASLTQEAPQQRVDISLRRPALDEAARLYRLVNHGVLGVTHRFERIKRAPQQRLDHCIGPSAAGQARDDRLDATVATQRAVRQIDQRRAGVRLA